MAKIKSLKKKTEISKISENNKECESGGRCKSTMILIFVLLGLNIVFSLGILMSLNNNSNSGMNPNSINTQISNIETKVSAIDNFFRTNVQGYGSGTVAQPSKNANTQGSNKIVNVSASNSPFEGNANAKVTVIEFSDYECPFCRKYWTESYAQLKKDYIDTNKIKYVFRNFPLSFHKSAIPAAIAASCVREQLGNSGYFKFHDIVFSEQNKHGPNTYEFSNAEILAWVKLVGGVDMTKYNTCIVDPKIKAAINKDIAAGTKAGVSGTPSFFINGKMLVGAQPYSVIKATIDAALAK